MNEKVFKLLEKMYVEIQEIKSSIATKQDLARLENEMKNDIKALYDGYKQNFEGITEIRGKLDNLTEKVENQEIRLQVIKSGK